ncbi:uncharacterized protein C2845_PM01G41140 [Panicum miliaceum]|uniref:Uncharacterized protein n=1 Tax=Panicum miliaceum TaxID=4540 RepID=A0A3L6TKN5_PANMI|nr:uncharacterized protein C2845_PM01G41140 [Panicum miliaceum]
MYLTARNWAHKIRSSQNTKKRGRGPVKGLKAMNKRTKSGEQKLKIEFSRLGGPVGENERMFIDEVVMFSRKRTPLIGVKSWSDIDQDVKDLIASDVLAKWDIEDTYDTRKTIWKIAAARYSGWRSGFSSTYRAYDTYDKRMRNCPIDLDIVEWHYLVKFFGSPHFQSISTRNIAIQSQIKNQHLTGSKPFAQVSHEKRNPEIGEEPTDL